MVSVSVSVSSSLVPRLSGSVTILLLLLVAIFTSSVSSQDPLIPSSGSDTFPACAVQCPLLNEAQSSCQAAPATGRDSLVSCFCQSALLTSLHSVPDGVCDASCPSKDDQEKLQSWYSSFCASGGDPPSSEPTTTASSPDSSSTGGTSQGSSGSGGSGGSGGPGHQSWIEGHWRWVVMIVVLVIGFTALAVGGVYLRRRYHRKHDPIVTGSGILPPPAHRSSSAMQQSEVWGPQQQTVHPRGAEFVDGNPSHSDPYLPHGSETSTPDVAAMGRMTPNSGNTRLGRGRGMI